MIFYGRGVLASVLVMLMLSGCALQPTARFEYAPLPDDEDIAFPSGEQPRERIVALAMMEWRRWGEQRVELDQDGRSCVVASPLLSTATPMEEAPASDAPASETCLDFPDGFGAEATLAGCTLAQRYWRIVGKEPDCAQITTGEWAWSAVFISWVMRKAQLDQEQFLTGDSHAHYVTDARDEILSRPAFKVLSLPAAPQVGDMVCAVRGRAVQWVAAPDDILFDGTPMHCDIVVAADPAKHTLNLIGGNVQQSVSMTVADTDDAGMIHYDGNARRPWILVMRNQLP